MILRVVLNALKWALREVECPLIAADVAAEAAVAEAAGSLSALGLEQLEAALRKAEAENGALRAELEELRNTFRNKARVDTCKKQLQRADDQGRIKDAFERISGGARVMSVGPPTSHDGVLGVIQAAVKMVNDDSLDK